MRKDMHECMADVDADQLQLQHAALRWKYA